MPDDDQVQEHLINHLVAHVAKVISAGISDEEMEEILQNKGMPKDEWEPKGEE